MFRAQRGSYIFKPNYLLLTLRYLATNPRQTLTSKSNQQKNHVVNCPAAQSAAASWRQLTRLKWLSWSCNPHTSRVIVVYSSAFVRMMARRSRAPAPSIASVACIPTGRCWITTWSQKRALRRWRQSPSCNITPSISINPFEGLLRNHCCHLATFSYHALHDRTPLVTFTRSIRFGFC